MTFYKVGNITFSLKYNENNQYFKTLSNYITLEGTPRHNIKTVFSNNILMPKGKLVESFNKEVITDKERFIIYEQDGIISATINNDHQYKDVVVTLNKDVIKDIDRMEYVYVGIAFLEIAIKNNYLPLHGSAINYNDFLFIVSAPSGTGKSTHRRYWQNYDNSVEIINDDKPLLRFDDDIYVLGAPFSGEDVINKNKEEKLQAIFFLKQGKENKLEEMTKTDKITSIIENIYKPKYDEDWPLILFYIEQLVEKIPMYTYYATNSIDAVSTLHQIIKSKFNK